MTLCKKPRRPEIVQKRMLLTSKKPTKSLHQTANPLTSTGSAQRRFLASVELRRGRGGMEMKNKIRIKRFEAGSLFKLVFISILMLLLPFSILMGIFSLFGAETIMWNNKPITGIAGLIVSPFLGLFVSIIFSIFVWVVLFIGLWIYSKFKSIELEFIGPEE